MSAKIIFMEKSEHQLNIESVQETYHFLDLTFEQAEQVLKYEKIKNASFSKHIMSVWENWDYELLIFDGILNENQRILFEDLRKQLYAEYAKSYTTQDKESVRWTDFHRATIEYLKNSLIPSLLKQPSPVFPPVFHDDRNKIDYLKACYKVFLQDRGKEAVVNHIRLSRTFAPNRWKQTMLAHYTQCLLPDYWAFECTMDVPTRSVAQYLKERLYRRSTEVEEFQSQKLQEFKEFNRINYAKFNQPIAGWHSETRNPFSEEDEKVHWAMSLLLLDKNAYGFEDPC